MPAVVDPPTTPSRPAPVRTCIGCRQRAATAELFRVVVVHGALGTSPVRPSGEQPERGPVGVSVVPDPRRCESGRGAWLHPDPGCVALATRRRAFGRALRVPEPVHSAAIEEYVADVPTSTIRPISGETAGDDER